MTADDIRARFEAGLRLDHLEPDALGAFIRRLPARVGAAVADLAPPDDDDPTPVDDEPESSVATNRDQDQHQLVARLQTMVDEVDRLIGRLHDLGYPPRTGVDAASADVGVDLEPDVQALVDRLEAGANEAAALLAGLPPAGWVEQPDLLDGGRAAVAEISWHLRQLVESTPEG
ncbi:MAG: hypothetical protein AAGK32_09100 [Actinomycetota bacterium]